MVRSSLAPKWSKPTPFCGRYHKKSKLLLISGTLSFEGCWGQPMSFFWKLVDGTQISKPPEATKNHNSIKLLILLPLRADLLYIHHNETPCMRNINRSIFLQKMKRLILKKINSMNCLVNIHFFTSTDPLTLSLICM